MPFSELIRSVVGENADIHRIVQKCCEKCGLPDGCSCVEDIIDSEAWKKWPEGEIAKILTEAKKRPH